MANNKYKKSFIYFLCALWKIPWKKKSSKYMICKKIGGKKIFAFYDGSNVCPPRSNCENGYDEEKMYM